MNRIEAAQLVDTFFKGLKNAGMAQPGLTLKPFLDLILMLKKDLPVSIPLLRDLADLESGSKAAMDGKPGKTTGLLTGALTGQTSTGYTEGTLKRRIERRYLRLCRNQEELGRLDLKKASPGISPEDFIFSQIDFTRYREIDESYFYSFFPEGLKDFDESFLRNTFGLGRNEIQSLIEGSYRIAEGKRKIRQDTPLVLSLMRTLETSLESLDLFSAGEINEEVKNLWAYVTGRENQELPPGAEKLYRFLVLGLDKAIFTHADGMETKLFISPQGDLSGTFRPGGKPWTLTLIPNRH